MLEIAAALDRRLMPRLTEDAQQADRTIILTLVKISDTGGAHDQFWRRFYKYLSDVSTAVVGNNEPRATEIVSEISSIQAMLASNGLAAGTWLSSIRNEINYRHEHGVWFPYGLAASAAASVRRTSARLSGTYRLDHNASKDPILAFSASCHFVASVNTELSTTLSKRNATRRFAKLWERLTDKANS